jgi:hypothetical protein
MFYVATKKMFKESYEDLIKVFGNEKEGTLFNNYHGVFEALDDFKKYNIMRMFTVIIHKNNIHCPGHLLSFKDVQDDTRLHKAFMLCFNYAMA